MLAEGGNAIDAVVAAAFTGFVVEPESCGLGGYGHLAIFLAETSELLTVDHSPRAPRRARPDMFALDETKPPLYYGWPRAADAGNEHGHLAAAVPGAVGGLCAAHERWGRLPLPHVVEPAVEAAEAGVEVTWSLALAILSGLEFIRAHPHAAALLLRNGDPPRYRGYWGAGERLDVSDLAGTLRRIAAEGAAGFYAGPVAEAIEREFAANGGILDAADLAAYKPKILREKPASYRGYSYITANDQVGYETLNILERFELARYGPDSVEFRHLTAEACGHAFADNMAYYGDPEHTSSPVNGLASPGFAAERAAALRLDRAASRPIVPGDPWPYETEWEAPENIVVEPSAGGPHGTSQMAAADREGNMAALITTLTHGFGSCVLVPGTGVFLNNSMINYDPRPGRPNSIAPGKMPFFAVPALVAARGGRAVFAACGSGGYRILSGVVHTFVNAIDFGLPLELAVDAPRIHCQGDETFVDSRIPEGVQTKLAELGHRVVPETEDPGGLGFARVSAVGVDARTGLLHGAAGPAWSAAAAGL
jgi:gamma-glutamyltranspeptidase/glutathione hydrolase